MIRFSTRLSPEAKFCFRNFRLKLFGDISMPAIQSRNYPGERQSTTTEFTATIQLLISAAREAGQGRGRFEIYKLLRTVHRVHIGWKQRRSAKMSARALAADLSITLRRGMSPIRVLIEGALPQADVKQKSGWVRALEYASSENVPAKAFRKFLRQHGGLAGCARLAAQQNRKRRRPSGEWND